MTPKSARIFATIVFTLTTAFGAAAIVSSSARAQTAPGDGEGGCNLCSEGVSCNGGYYSGMSMCTTPCIQIWDCLVV